MNDSLIEFNNVSFTYEEETDEKYLVLKDINLKINKGEFVVILGHNGSGKSTIAKLSNGILLPSKGSITVNGIATTDEAHEFDIRKTVGVVFQNPDNQIVASIVEEDVAFGPENLGVPPKEIRKRVDDALKATGIYDYRFHETHRLSGGQKQRVAIAGIIAMQPECIVLDEPTAMLDPSGRKDVISTIHRLNSELGKAVVLITHFMEEAVDADRVIVVDNGRILIEGTPREVFAQEELLSKCGLDIPEITQIGNALKNQGADIPDTVLKENELAEALRKLIG